MLQMLKEKSSNYNPGYILTYETTMIGKNGASVHANVVVVIQQDKGQTIYRIITVYPGKKV